MRLTLRSITGVGRLLCFLAPGYESTAAQSQLLREERVDDADWAPVVDQLNLALHATPEI